VSDPSTRHLVVDAMNVIGSRPTGWWRDRDAALRELVARLQRLSAADQQPVTVIADGRALADLPEGVRQGVEVLYATRGGRNAADDRIVEFVASHGDATSLEVVTSDRELAARVAANGARVRGASSLLQRLDALTQ
jgi:predicted RNA-binding protein with PIN domain